MDIVQEKVKELIREYTKRIEDKEFEKHETSKRCPLKELIKAKTLRKEYMETCKTCKINRTRYCP